MGTPDSYYFSCPQCGEKLLFQVYAGVCETKELSNICSCEAEAIAREQDEKESIFHNGVLCEKCKFKIYLELRYGMRKSAYIVPIINRLRG